MMVILDDHALLRFGTTADPAYLMTISALPHMIAPVMNLRHTALIQSVMEEILHIPRSRGVIRFESMPEENFATNGTTIKDEIEQMDRTSHEDNNSLMKSISRTVTRKSKPNASKNANPTAPLNPSRVSPIQRFSTEDDIPEEPSTVTDKGKTIKRYKSLAKFFSR